MTIAATEMTTAGVAIMGVHVTITTTAIDCRGLTGRDYFDGIFRFSVRKLKISGCFTSLEPV